MCMHTHLILMWFYYFFSGIGVNVKFHSCSCEPPVYSKQKIFISVCIKVSPKFVILYVHMHMHTRTYTQSNTSTALFHACLFTDAFIVSVVDRRWLDEQAVPLLSTWMSGDGCSSGLFYWCVPLCPYNCIIRVFWVQVYVVLKYFNRVVHINVWAS